MPLFLRWAISLAHMLMERVIHFLFRKGTCQAQFEGLPERHMHNVSLVSCARWLSKEQWKPPMSKLVSCPLWLFTEMLIRPTGKVDTGRVCPLSVDLGSTCGVWLKAAHNLKSDTTPTLAGWFLLVPLFYLFSSTLCMKDEISLKQSIPLEESTALAILTTRKVKSQIFGSGWRGSVSFISLMAPRPAVPFTWDELWLRLMEQLAQGPSITSQK